MNYSNYRKNRIFVRWNTSHLDNKTSRLRPKRGRKDYIFKFNIQHQRYNKYFLKEIECFAVLGAIEKANDS